MVAQGPKWDVKRLDQIAQAPQHFLQVMTRRELLRSGVGAPFLARAAASSERAPVNVLFIVADDLRCELGCYGRTWVRTPNIDRLASQGVTFRHAYCQISLCSPSRTSVMTGLRPDTTRIFDLRTHFRKYQPQAITLPQKFINQGYTTTAFSKIYHLGNHTPGGLDDPDSWSEPSWHPGGPKWGTRACKAQAELQRRMLAAHEWTCDIGLASTDRIKGGGVWEVPSVEPLNDRHPSLTDGLTTDAAIEALEQMRGKPFFLAVGYLNPHLPFNAPQRFFDMYPLESIRLPARRKPPVGVPECALHNFGELRQYNDIPWVGEITEVKTRELIRGYYAATTYLDEQIGRLLDALDEQGLSKNTIVVLWGDNGYHLGDLGLWSKHTNFEEATRIPLIVRAPGVRAKGAHCDALVELVDLYPTLCELAGLPAAKGVEGKSLASLLDNPALPWKKAACSQFPRNVPVEGDLMGYSIRTARYRYTEWHAPGKRVAARELYDYLEDPLESENLAAKPAKQAVMQELTVLMRQFGTAALQEPSANA